MSLKSLLPSLCGLKRSFRFSSHKGFLANDVAQLFQSPRMAGQIAVRQRKQFLQGVEIHIFIYHQDGHYAQADFTFECLIYILKCFYHLSPFPFILQIKQYTIQDMEATEPDCPKQQAMSFKETVCNAQAKECISQPGHIGISKL